MRIVRSPCSSLEWTESQREKKRVKVGYSNLECSQYGSVNIIGLGNLLGGSKVYTSTDFGHFKSCGADTILLTLAH
jgi:hypothetical protein